MLLQYFDNVQQNSRFTEHNGAEFFKVICEFKYIYSSKNPNIAYKHSKIRVGNLMHKGYFFLAVSKLSLQCPHMLGKKEMPLENREETLKKNS